MPPLASDSTGEAGEVEGELFIQGEGDAQDIAMNDVRQGALGDCYFVAVLASIARVRPDLIRDMVADNGDGTYTVTFHARQGWSGLFGEYSEKTVTVDGQFWQADGQPIYAKGGDKGSDGIELWVMVIEKAWAQMHGGYGEITGGNVDSNARTAVTGHAADGVDPSGLSDAALFARIKAHFTDGNEPAVFWSKGDAKKIAEDSGVVANHEYALDDVDVDQSTVTLYNPWGRKHLDGVDMAFIKQNFQRVRLINVDAP